MSYQYATRKRTETAAPQTEKAAPAAPSMDALRAELRRLPSRCWATR